MIVVCVNDYPHCTLPAGTTDEQAMAFCREREQKDVRNIEVRKRSEYATAVYYHWHDVPEEAL
jgi:hypothetical protein